jgi:cytidylate kinase
MKKRLESDRLRYQKYYGIDVNDKKHYDFYLDTTNLSPEEVFKAVYDWVEKQLDKAKN